MRRPARILGALLTVLVGLALARPVRAEDALRDTASFGRYAPTAGFKVASTKNGELNIRLYTYIRYLNQQAIDADYTDSFGTVKTVQRRQDIQVNKMQVYFFGWILEKKLRYTSYIWTSNSSLGTTSQLVLAGNIQYTFDPALNLGVGVNGLPGVRSTEGNFPYWLSVDNRQIADEYMRPSYTTGAWFTGDLPHRFAYQAMVGNNLSQFGIDAAQLDNRLNTYSGSLVWKPSTGEFGKAGGYGDYDRHEQVATRLGVHATHSVEDRQAQPTTDAFDNVQIRISDGNVIFAPNLFATDFQIDQATYDMVSGDVGVKYRGWSLEAEYYWRGIRAFRGHGTGVLPFDQLNDTGFQVWASAMAIPEKLQLYAAGSQVFGQYGDPSDVRIGATVFPYRNQVLRWNFEFIRLADSPVGALSLPYSVGSNGTVFHTDLMLWF